MVDFYPYRILSHRIFSKVIVHNTVLQHTAFREKNCFFQSIFRYQLNDFIHP